MMSGRVRETGPVQPSMGSAAPSAAAFGMLRSVTTFVAVSSSRRRNDLLKLGTDIVAVIWLGVQCARRLSFSPKLLQLLRDWW
jgi:hypothetical protein